MAAAVAISALALAGCQTTGDGRGNNQQSGFLLGGLAGAAAGAQFGSGEGRLVAVVVGALVGALAGGAIGASLDDADRLRAENAARQAANAPSAGVVHWQSEKNKDVHGWAEPASAAALDGDDLCKQVKSIYYLSGQEQTETKRFCLQDGRWTEA
ncbi:hypothetical protein BAL199_18506 [alpha proteobacterium BAL199]|jgi:surface antigen|nr:hypothetical protein BAL199_18506 [alpha proteobacterium BAL199]